jgi:aspartyl-tRNA(Asn)/glutamyl-tRNA(Gln) amidotransferase subunit A
MNPNMMTTIESLQRQYVAGETTAQQVVAMALERISDPAGEGARAFVRVNAAAAKREARAFDEQRVAGKSGGPLAGVTISIKDLFDVAGEVTTAGSIILRDSPPAQRDAPAIARLRAAGAIFVGRTNMTEFAYGGHGINAHYGTPPNPWDRSAKRVPGGSTSGGAVSVTDGMAVATIGSDTGGSVRIPAALCGLAGFKPTQARIPLEGAFPLSHSRDSIGPLAASARCCIVLDRIMAGEAPVVPAPASLSGITLAVPTTFVLEGLDRDVEQSFARALSALSRAGARIREIPFTELQDEADSAKTVNFSAYEAYALHRERLETRYADFDPMVAKRLMFGANMKEKDYRELVATRVKLRASADRTTADYAALIMPTIAIVAPSIDEMRASEEAFFRINGVLLRNCAPFNVFDRPTWSLPCHRQGEAPVGLMVVGATGDDHRLQALGLSIEAALAEG